MNFYGDLIKNRPELFGKGCTEARFAIGDQDPHVIQCSFGFQESPPETGASNPSVIFLHREPTHQTGKQTDWHAKGSSTAKCNHCCLKTCNCEKNIKILQ